MKLEMTLDELLKAYTDLQVLHSKGMWPDGRVPDWARTISWRLGGCGPASSAVESVLYQNLIDTLLAERYEVGNLLREIRTLITEIKNESVVVAS